MKTPKFTLVLPLLSMSGNKWAVSHSPELRGDMFQVGHNIVLSIRGERKAHKVMRVDHDGEHITATLKSVQLSDFPVEVLQKGGWVVSNTDPSLPIA